MTNVGRIGISRFARNVISSALQPYENVTLTRNVIPNARRAAGV